MPHGGDSTVDYITRTPDGSYLLDRSPPLRPSLPLAFSGQLATEIQPFSHLAIDSTTRQPSHLLARFSASSPPHRFLALQAACVTGRCIKLSPTVGAPKIVGYVGDSWRAESLVSHARSGEKFTAAITRADVVS